jgi:hypothetical protein
MGSKHGIKEITEALDFLTMIMQDMAKANQDGKIDGMEWAKIIITSAPKAVTAIKGIEMVDDELKDLSPEEMQQVAVHCMALAHAAAALFKKGE